MSFGAVAASVAGAAVGGMMNKKGGGGSTTSKAELDPRLASLIYGDGDYKPSALMGDMTNLYGTQLAQGGINPWQLAGLEAQRQVLTHPSFTAGYDDMRSLGRSLMGGGVAGNPFTSAASAGRGVGAGGAAVARPGGQGFSYNLQGPAYQATQMLQAYNPTAQAPGTQSSQQYTQSDIDKMIEDYLTRQRNGTETFIGSDNGTY